MTTQTLPDGADRVTVVVLTHQRRHEVLRTVTKLRALAASPRIVVIDNASTDGTAAALRDGGVHVVRLSRNVGAAARNIGLRAATTPYVAFCDDDTWWSDTGLRAAAEFLDANPAVAIVSGHVLVGDNQRIDPTCAVMAATPLAGGTTNTGFPVLGFLAGAALVRRDALLQAGGFPWRYFIGGEEEPLAIELRARSWQLRYLPAAVVYHQPSPLRDASARAWLVERNRLWTALCRFPLKLAWHEVRRSIRSPSDRRAQISLLTDTVLALPWLLRSRRVVPAWLATEIRLVRGIGTQEPMASDRPARWQRASGSAESPAASSPAGARSGWRRAAAPR